MDARTEHLLDEYQQILNELDGTKLYTVNELAQVCPDDDVLRCFDYFDRIPAKAVLSVLAIKLGANVWEAEPGETGEPGFYEIRELLRRRIQWLKNFELESYEVQF